MNLSIKEDFIPFRDISDYQLEAWNNFLGLQLSLNERFCNPLRADKNPDAVLRYREGYVRIFDSPYVYHGKTIVQVIMEEQSLPYRRAVYYIYKVLLEGSPTIRQKIHVSDVPFSIKIQKRSWIPKDGLFWGICGISARQLNEEKLFPVKKYWSGYKFLKETTPMIDVYANYINGKVKLYGPAERLFLTDMTADCIGGFKPFKDRELLIITKNLKSYLCLVNCGYNTRYVPSESGLLTIRFIREISDFKEVWFLMDNDSAGFNYSHKLREQWISEVGHTCKIVSFDYDETYIDAYGNTKHIRDAYDVAFAYDKERLQRDLEEMKITKKLPYE